VNVSKSEVVVFNGARTARRNFTFAGKVLEQKEEFNFLGVLFGEEGHMDKAAEYASRPFMAGIKRVNETAHEYCVEDRPHAVLWLFQTYALSAGMYGSQIWSTPYLNRADKAKLLTVHVRHVGFLKQVLGVKRSTSSEVVLRETGQLPLEFYWFRAVVKFWNAAQKLCFESNGCDVLRDVMKADLELAKCRPDINCWSKEVCDALRNLPGGQALAFNVENKKTVDMGVFVKSLQVQMDGVWVKAQGQQGPRSAGVVNRKLVTYEHWFGIERDKEGKPPTPQYLRCSLPRSVIRNMARFRVSAHHLNVETGRYNGIRWDNRVCEFCASGQVQDEQHVMFECTSTSQLRDKYPSLMGRAAGELRRLMNDDHVKVARLVSDCVDLIEFLKSDDSNRFETEQLF
jgi:hypothetical protein